MKIGLIDVDGHNYPNLALMKLSAYHKAKGDKVEWYSIFGGQYDVVYMSKVFTHKPDYGQSIPNADKIIKGGTGYDMTSRLPEQAEKIVPDYTLYPFIDKKIAYGFLTRGCIRKCPWCVVPKKEGKIHPYQDVDEIAVNGRTNLVLMDNNILASGEYGIEQLKKIRKRGYRVDFNQAMDARLVTGDIAKLLTEIRWMHSRIRFACDTKEDIDSCENTIGLLIENGFRGEIFLYTMIGGNNDLQECYERTMHWWKRNKELRPKGISIAIFAQPYIDFTLKTQNIPKWQNDMAQWACKHQYFNSVTFENFMPRKDFKCKDYFQKKIETTINPQYNNPLGTPSLKSHVDRQLRLLP